MGEHYDVMMIVFQQSSAPYNVQYMPREWLFPTKRSKRTNYVHLSHEVVHGNEQNVATACNVMQGCGQPISSVPLFS